MTAKSVLVRSQGLRPRARAPTFLRHWVYPSPRRLLWRRHVV